MTWTSPDTGVADRPDQGPLVQRRPSAEQHGLIMPSRVASTHAGQARRLGITLRVPLATRGPAKFPGLWLWPRAAPRRVVIAAQWLAHSIVTAAGICFECVTNWMHLSDISGGREAPSTLLLGQVTERNVYATVQRRPGRRLCRGSRPRTGPHSLTRMSYSRARPVPPQDAPAVLPQRPRRHTDPAGATRGRATGGRPGPREAWATRAGRGHEGRPGHERPAGLDRAWAA